MGSTQEKPKINKTKKLCGGEKTRKQIFTFGFCHQPFTKCDSAGSVSLCHEWQFLSPFYREISNILPFHNALESKRMSALRLATIKINFQFKKYSIVGICFPLITSRLLSVENNQFEGRSGAANERLHKCSRDDVIGNKIQ